MEKVKAKCVVGGSWNVTYAYGEQYTTYVVTDCVHLSSGICLLVETSPKIYLSLNIFIFFFYYFFVYFATPNSPLRAVLWLVGRLQRPDQHHHQLLPLQEDQRRQPPRLDPRQGRRRRRHHRRAELGRHGALHVRQAPALPRPGRPGGINFFYTYIIKLVNNLIR